MATRLYAVRPGGQVTTSTNDIIEGVGGVASSAFKINFTVDLATTIISDGATTRAVKKEEVLDALEMLKIYIIKGNWPPA